MKRNFVDAIAIVFVLLFFLTTPTWGQSPDFYTGIDCDAGPVAPGDSVEHSVLAANSGDGATTHAIILDVYLPTGVPCKVNDYLADDQDAVTAFNNMNSSIGITETINDDTNTGFFFGVDGYCESFLLQGQQLDVQAGVSGWIVYDIETPELPLETGAIHVTSASVNADLNFGHAGCETGGDCHDHHCLGPRINTIPAITATVEMVNDGGANPSEGCSALTGFTAGNIAFIQRGTCDFEVKINNALTAGASAVIIGDTDNFSDSTTEPDDILNMACTNFCSEVLITIPSVFLSYNDSEAIKTDLATGVTASFGLKDTGGLLNTSSMIWEEVTSPQTPDDSDMTNNSADATTIVIAGYLFHNGFESGTFSGWSYTTGTAKGTSAPTNLSLVNSFRQAPLATD